MSRAFKIVVTGPFDSGKTTFISSISEIEVVSTEKTTRVGGRTASTTVAMDFGRITLSDGDVLHLYGTPGQARFDFMWEILSEGMLGLVVLVDGSRPSGFEECGEIIRAFERISDAPYVIALTRADRRDCVDAAEAARLFGHDDVVRCDARRVRDVKDVLLALLERLVERAEAAERAG